MSTVIRFSVPLCLFLAVSLMCAPLACAVTVEELFPETPDPFTGDYVGRWSAEEDVDPDICAQVFPLGRDRYQINLVSALDMRCPPLLVVQVEKAGETLSFKENGLFGEVKDGMIIGGRRAKAATFEMKKVVRVSPTMGAQPPADAVVLFDGSNLDQWQDPQGWEILPDGTLMVTPNGKTLESKGKYKDAKLHIEFRTPYMPSARGQQRGNSGVFLQGTYEVQVLDSYGLEGYNNECGALYKVSAPHVNACAPPLQWQTYDIEYRAPRFNADGSVSEFPRMTVHHNGVLIHNNQEMRWITGWKEKDRLAPPPAEPGPIQLQSHHNYVQFRNIWLVDLGEQQ